MSDDPLASWKAELAVAENYAAQILQEIALSRSNFNTSDTLYRESVIGWVRRYPTRESAALNALADGIRLNSEGARRMGCTHKVTLFEDFLNVVQQERLKVH